MKVDKNRLHELFMSGMLMTEIGKELGMNSDYVQSIISKERKKNPAKWPKRRAQRPNADNQVIPSVNMHLYECTDCFCTFGVEDYESIDQSVVICPICHTDESLEDKGYGYFTVTFPAEEAGEAG